MGKSQTSPKTRTKIAKRKKSEARRKLTAMLTKPRMRQRTAPTEDIAKAQESRVRSITNLPTEVLENILSFLITHSPATSMLQRQKAV
jgi:hypothetical protein